MLLTLGDTFPIETIRALLTSIHQTMQMKTTLTLEKTMQTPLRQLQMSWTTSFPVLNAVWSHHQTRMMKASRNGVWIWMMRIGIKPSAGQTMTLMLTRLSQSPLALNGVDFLWSHHRMMNSVKAGPQGGQALSHTQPEFYADLASQDYSIPSRQRLLELAHLRKWCYAHRRADH